MLHLFKAKILQQCRQDSLRGETWCKNHMTFAWLPNTGSEKAFDLKCSSFLVWRVFIPRPGIIHYSNGWHLLKLNIETPQTKKTPLRLKELNLSCHRYVSVKCTNLLCSRCISDGLQQECDLVLARDRVIGLLQRKLIDSGKNETCHLVLTDASTTDAQF